MPAGCLVVPVSAAAYDRLSTVVHFIFFCYLMLYCGSCFTVPFDEDEREASVWYLDHDYLENMYGMFKKVNG